MAAVEGRKISYAEYFYSKGQDISVYTHLKKYTLQNLPFRIVTAIKISLLKF